MKKKLKYLIPAALVIVIAIGLLAALLPRYAGSGEGVMTLFCLTGDSDQLVQIRENGTRQYRLDIYATPTFSTNGRYAAVGVRENGKTVNQVYDLENPKKPLFSVADYMTHLLATDTGWLVGYKTGGELSCHDGDQSYILDKQAFYDNIQVLENTVYYFRQVGDETYDLYACDLPNGTPRLLGEDLRPQSLLVCLWEGRHYVLADRRTHYTGSLYEQVIDDAGEEMAELRQALKDKEASATLTDIFRWVDGEKTLLAEGVLGAYRAEPVSGTVVCRYSSFVRPQKKLSELTEAQVSEIRIWCATANGVTTELSRRKSIDPVITPAGEIFLLQSAELLHWRDTGATKEVLLTDANNFRVLIDENGTAEVYLLTEEQALLHLTDGETETVTAYTTGAFFPASTLPGGASLKTDDAIFYERPADEALREPGPVTMSMISIERFPNMTLCRLKNGVETPLINGRLMDGAKAVTRDGQVLVKGSGGWFLVGGNRSDLVLPNSSTVYFSNRWQVIGLEFLSTYSTGTGLV